jgi:uncharacterized protein YxeA
VTKKIIISIIAVVMLITLGATYFFNIGVDNQGIENGWLKKE